MSLATCYTRAESGIQAPPVAVEVHLSGGLPTLTLVGLPETAVRESRDRVRAAISNAGYDFPTGRVTINLAPADLPKEGGRFDLAIAIAILAASGQLPGHLLGDIELIGELGLGGELRPVRGVLPVTLAARAAGKSLILPRACAEEAALVGGIELLAADHLLAVCAHLQGQQALPLVVANAQPQAPAIAYADLAEVRGQHQARRALEIAAAGEHNLLMIGPPGTGKTMLASRLPGILPALSEDEALQTCAIASLVGRLDSADWRRRPFRQPHHTASAVALVGGGGKPRPGEISLAHNGVLFLDELPEFGRVLEVLREPLESGRINISRAAQQAEFPARFQLVAAMNPCPCGHLGDNSGRCRCSDEQISRYRGRVSGPLLDRIDLHVEVARQGLAAQDPDADAESSARVRERVVAARARQIARTGCSNARLDAAGTKRHCALSAADQKQMERALDRLGLSLRSYDRIRRVARTIADLEDSEHILTPHLMEAMSLRRLDRGRDRNRSGTT